MYGKVFPVKNIPNLESIKEVLLQWFMTFLKKVFITYLQLVNELHEPAIIQLQNFQATAYFMVRIWTNELMNLCDKETCFCWVLLIVLLNKHGLFL